MRAVLKYLRLHPWQRRVMTLSLAAVLGVTATWLLWPGWRDRQILKSLRVKDPARRRPGVARAVEVAKRRPELIELLERRLGSAGDEQFEGIARVLEELKRFHTPQRDGEVIDRLRAVRFNEAPGPAGLGERLGELTGLTLDGRDNAHVRGVLELAPGDAEAEVRAASAVLAARLGNDRALGRLLADAAPRVRAAAAMDAGLAGRIECIEKIAGIFESAEGDDEIAAAAYALARLAPRRYGKPIAARAVKAWEAGEEVLLERLLYVATLLKQDVAGPAIVTILNGAARKGEDPPAMALVAAGRLKLAAARASVERVLAGVLARKRDELTVGDAQMLAAAASAARRLGLSDGASLKVIRELWYPTTEQAMILTVEALAAGAERDSGDGAPREDIAQALQQAAGYELADPDDPQRKIRTPVASAAAAVALFRLAPDRAEDALRAACASETWLAGDYVAWNVARADARRQEASRIATTFTGPGVYDDGVRTAGAILLALLARGTDRADEAAAAVERKLAGGPLGARPDAFAAGSYKCALLMLGRGEFAGEVASLARSGFFPKRRALAALMLAGEAAGLDVVLAAARFDPETMDSFLTGRLMARVYAAVAAELPAFDVAAPPRARHWQCRLLRDFYLIHRVSILDRMRL